MSNILNTASRSLLFLCAMLLCLGAGAQKKKTSKYNVSGKITLFTPFCGEEPPEPGSKEAGPQTKPYTGKTLYVRKGIVNDAKEPVILKFTADKNGEFSFNLAPGRYVVIQEEQVKPLKMKNYESKGQLLINQECLRQWWPKPLQILEVTDKNIEGLEFKFTKICFLEGDLPCRRYVRHTTESKIKN